MSAESPATPRKKKSKLLLLAIAIVFLGAGAAVPFVVPVSAIFAAAKSEKKAHAEAKPVSVPFGEVVVNRGHRAGRDDQPGQGRVLKEPHILLFIERAGGLRALGQSPPGHFVGPADSELNVDVAPVGFKLRPRPASARLPVDDDVHPVAVDLMTPGGKVVQVRRSQVLEGGSETGVNRRVPAGFSQLI